MNDVASLRALLSVCVPLPWTFSEESIRPRVNGFTVTDANGMWVADCDADENAARLIAAAVTALPFLLDELELLRRHNDAPMLVNRCLVCGGDGYHGPYCWMPAFVNAMEQSSADRIAKFLVDNAMVPDDVLAAIREGRWKR